MKPVIVLTLHRRYHELVRALARIEELPEKPDVILVWSQPEVSRLWLIKEYLERGIITHVIGRPALLGEHARGGTTYPESHNLRIGLEYVKKKYSSEKFFAIAQAADVLPYVGTYEYVRAQFDSEALAVLFHWENGCVPHGIWCTNFFGVCLDERYWPPLASITDQDVLEHKWGKQLDASGLSGVVTTHNYAGRRFAHEHLSEGLPSFEERPQKQTNSLTLMAVGSKSLWRKLKEFFFWWRK